MDCFELKGESALLIEGRMLKKTIAEAIAYLFICSKIDKHGFDKWGTSPLTLPFRANSRHSAKSVSHHICGTGFVVELTSIFFKKEAPTTDSLRRELRQFVGEVLVIGVNVDLSS